MMERRISENEWFQGWDVTTLGEICNINIGKTPPTNQAKYWGGNHTWVSISDMTSEVVNESSRTVTDRAIADGQVRLVKKGTLLMSFKLTIGKLAFAGKDLFTNEAIAALEVKDKYKDRVIPKYLFWCLQVVPLETEASLAVKGKTINKKTMPNIRLPLPPKDEQRRIVARLEALLSEVRALRDLLQSMRRDWSALMESALAEVFPHHEQALPEGWEWVKVDKVANDTTRRNPESEPDKPFQYIDIAAVDNQEFTIVPERVKTLLGQDAPSRARKVIHAQNTILATTRPYLKNAALVTEQFDNQICSTGFCVLCPIPEKIDYRYLYHSVKADSFIKQLIPLQRGANYPAVSDSDVFACEIPVPYPDDPARSLAKQRRIVAYLEAVQEEVSAARRQVEEDERRVTQLEQSILAAAFRGEV